MMNLESLKKVASGAKSTVTGMQKVIDSLNGKIEQAEADKTRSQTYIAESIKAERDKAMPGLLKDLASLRDVAETVKPHREFWADRALLMSRIPFDSDSVADAQIRMSLTGSLAAMDQPLLAATQKNALVDGNLAVVWACVMAGRAAGHGDLADLTAVAIPQQSEALALIDGLDSSLAEGELIVAGAGGMSMSPAQKLTIAHRMQPNQPTRHTSADRAPITAEALAKAAA